MNDELYSLAQNKLEKARITLAIDDYDRKALARHKGAVFVCNHLLPGLDEWILLSLLSQHYEGVRIVFPYLNPPPKPLRSLAIRPLRSKLQDRLLQVNFFKKIAKAVKKGDAVGLSIDFSDNPLNYFGKNVLRRQILKQLRKAGQPIVPIHLQVHHRPGGLLRKAIPGLPYPASGAPLRVNVRVGNAIPPDDLALFPKNRIWGKFLQARIFSLGSTFEVRPELFTEKKPEALQPLAEPADPELLASEIAALKPEYKITERGQFDVYVAPFEALPNVMFEIARLRELTFRAAGEGTGKPRDLD
ncbi:MAG: hypothetical protein KDC70_08690, partial [Saprospiraceae bacterium]|nr:hypothetical protein [Saprospiraceae bacterium]